MKVYESTIQRGAQMPTMCELCTSIHKHKNVGVVAKDNACFKPRRKFEGLSEEAQRKMNAYAPFTNSKRTIQKTCGHFAHVKSVTESHGRKHTEGMLQTPFDDMKVLGR